MGIHVFKEHLPEQSLAKSRSCEVLKARPGSLDFDYQTKFDNRKFLSR